MDGLFEPAAAPITWTIGEREYRLSPLRARDYGDMERRILAARPDPLDVARSKLTGLPEALQKHLLSLAYDDARRGPRVTVPELVEWMSTVEGRIYQFWLALRQHHAEITVEEAGELLRQAGAEEQDIARRLDESSGLPLGNCWGQAQTPSR